MGINGSFTVNANVGSATDNYVISREDGKRGEFDEHGEQHADGQEPDAQRGWGDEFEHQHQRDAFERDDGGRGGLGQHHYFGSQRGGHHCGDGVRIGPEDQFVGSVVCDRLLPPIEIPATA